MTDEINERISALIDGELTDGVPGALDQIQNDESQRRVWDTYHLIGDAMRGEAERVSAQSIADRVREQLAQEADIVPLRPARSGSATPARAASSRWSKPLAGAALAASVAALAVLALPQLTTDPAIQQPSQLAKAPDLPPPTLTSERQWKTLLEPKVESKLNRYLIEHNEFAASRGMPGVLPYTNFVSYSKEKR